MGTRNLTAVWIDGQWKVAQYGQWDGYPDGQGRTALNFLRSTDLQAFAAKVRAARFATPEDIERINADLKEAGGFKSCPAWGYMSRDTGAEILQEIMDRPDGIILQDSHNFAADSLFCEWAYVIDFDARTFEVYTGFVEEPHTGQRFSDVKDSEDTSYRTTTYYPVKLTKTYNLDALPTYDEFIADLVPQEEDEGEA